MDFLDALLLMEVRTAPSVSSVRGPMSLLLGLFPCSAYNASWIRESRGALSTEPSMRRSLKTAKRQSATYNYAAACDDDGRNIAPNHFEGRKVLLHQQSTASGVVVISDGA